MQALAYCLGTAIFLNSLQAFGGLSVRCSLDRLQILPNKLRCKDAGPQLPADDKSWLLDM